MYYPWQPLTTNTFKEQLQNFAISPHSVRENLVAGNKQYAQKEHLLKTREKHITDVKNKIQSLFTLYENGQIQLDELSDQQMKNSRIIIIHLHIRQVS